MSAKQKLSKYCPQLSGSSLKAECICVARQTDAQSELRLRFWRIVGFFADCGANQPKSSSSAEKTSANKKTTRQQNWAQRKRNTKQIAKRHDRNVNSFLGCFQLCLTASLLRLLVCFAPSSQSGFSDSYLFAFLFANYRQIWLAFSERLSALQPQAWLTSKKSENSNKAQKTLIISPTTLQTSQSCALLRRLLLQLASLKQPLEHPSKRRLLQRRKQFEFRLSKAKQFRVWREIETKKREVSLRQVSIAAESQSALWLSDFLLDCLLLLVFCVVTSNKCWLPQQLTDLLVDY